MKRIILMLAISLVGVVAHAQTVMPLFAEGKTGKHWVKGQFTVQNQTVSPMPVSVEPRLMQVVGGKATFQTLDFNGTRNDFERGDVQVELKDTSAMIAPRGSRTFDFKVHCDEDCMVTFLNGFITGRNPQGITIKLILPSHVYLCDKPKGCRVRIKAAAGLP